MVICGCITTNTLPPSREAMDAANATAEGIFQSFNSGDYGQFSANLSAEMKAGINESNFQGMREQIRAKYGGYRSKSVPEASVAQGYNNFIYNCNFDGGTLKIRLVMSPANASIIDGLWFPEGITGGNNANPPTSKPEISWLNLLSGLGMIVVGVGAMVYWYFRKRINPIYFFAGGVLWAVAIAIKLIMDLTISSGLQLQVMTAFTPLLAVVVLGFYYGLRTGIFECGIPYLAVRYSRLSERLGFGEAVALGIGFGGTEAVLLGIVALASVAALLLTPGGVERLPASVLEQFSLIMVPVPILERFLTIFIHTFAIVLVVYAVKRNDFRWLVLSIIYKTLVDGPVPFFYQYPAGMGMSGTVIMELYIAVLAAVGLIGLIWISERWPSGRLAGAR